MNMTFRQLRLFLALADHGSVTRAARATHVTQPTASVQLRELSTSVGAPLYEVIAKQVHLTDVGRDLAHTARTMINDWATFKQRVDGLKGLTRGQLRVAMVSTAEYFVPRLLGTFCNLHPQIEISLAIQNRDGIVERLRENMDDLYIMSIPPRELEVERRDFLANPLVIIAPSGHPLADGRRHTLKSLANERFILRERGSGTRMAADAHFKKCGFRPNVRLELGSNEAIKQAVAAGMGIAVMSIHALGTSGTTDALAALSIQHFPIHAKWYLVHPRGKRLSPIASVFQAHLLNRSISPSDGPLRDDLVLAADRHL